jgi:predicted dithiol-disulfide oxidoreductase (DUF899 family)
MKGEIFHTYSSYARGPEELIGTLMILDRAPKGRNEDSTMSFRQAPRRIRARRRRRHPAATDGWDDR